MNKYSITIACAIVVAATLPFFQNCTGAMKAPVEDSGSKALQSLAGQTLAFVKKETRMGQNQHHIFLMDLNASGQAVNVRPLTSASDIAPEENPEWSPDGTKITYFNGIGVFVINADGTGKTLLIDHTTNCAVMPNWSPDGLQIVYSKLLISGCSTSGPNPPESEIRAINVDGTGDHLILGSGGGFNIEARWNANGKIVFMSNRAGSQDAFTVNADGTGLSQMTFSSSPGVGVAGDPNWSPDGSRISFGSNLQGAGYLNIFVLDILSGVVTRLSHFATVAGIAYEAGDTSWSSDGKWIAYEYDIDGAGQSDDNAYAEVQITAADGSTPSGIRTGQACTCVGCAPRFRP